MNSALQNNHQWNVGRYDALCGRTQSSEELKCNVKAGKM